jgi:hypothetical protein
VSKGLPTLGIFSEDADEWDGYTIEGFLHNSLFNISYSGWSHKGTACDCGGFVEVEVNGEPESLVCICPDFTTQFVISFMG